jgi:hypothetical protein
MERLRVIYEMAHQVMMMSVSLHFDERVHILREINSSELLSIFSRVQSSDHSSQRASSVGGYMSVSKIHAPLVPIYKKKRH